MQKEQVVRLLMVEDSMETAEQLVSMLRNGGIPVRPSRAESLPQLTQMITDTPPDLVLCSSANRRPTLTETVEAVVRSGKDIAVIALLAEVNEETMMNVFQTGARAAAIRSRPEHVQRIVKREFEDVSMRRAVRKLEIALREVEKRCDALLDSSSEPIAFIHEGMHVRANRAYLEMFGYESFEEIEGNPMLDMIGGGHADSFKTLLKRLSKGEDPPDRLEIKAQKLDGSEFDAVMVFDKATFEGEPCLQITFRQNEGSAEQAAELARLKQIDMATGMLNRAHFLIEIDRIAAEAASGKSDLALVLVEPDGYKKVLETVGVANADLLLADVAKVIQQALGNKAIIGRIGEHTFAAILSRVSHDQAEAAFKKLLSAFVEHVFELNQRSINVLVSAGGLLIGEKIAKPESIMAEAASALRTAQAEGGNRLTVHDPAAQEKADAEKHRAWLNLVKDALAHDGFVLFYQPVISLQGEDGEFYEILIRLHGPKGEIMPNFFLPIADRHGLMPAIDRWVISKAIRVAMEREREKRRSTFFIKITPKSIEDPKLIPWIGAQLAQARLRAQSLVFEMPESKIGASISSVREFRKGLQQLNCAFAIEQYGSGLNSQQTLKLVDPDYIKIDRTYMAELPRNKDNQAKIREICDMARSIDKVTIAEFVEDAASMSILFSCGVNFVQGNFLQEPEKVMAYDFG
ncbi:diguanylate cyclase [Ahniella affigens]|uniref:Diguanylate cyclase n=1 Tax=Ahniella affigens TaxID=2021234 RepID=A0A2P1PTE2_9GAMM|nr:EAL domain-containing protein [Ahniella affigens]AVP98092.1 diguanylate cyclase [Ahniella affigens]